MSLHIYNSNNKSWKMYTNTLSSISGDDLTIKPYDGKNISLEVSGNNAIFIKKGDTSYNLSNLITGTGLGTSATIVSGSDASFTNIDVSGNLNPLNANGSSLGSSAKIWGNAYIRDVSISNVDVSGSLNPLNANGSSLGTAVKYWNNAYIRDVSITNLDISGNLNPLNANSSSLGSSTKIWGNAYIRDISATNVDVSGNIIPSTSATTATGGTITTSGAYNIHSFTTVGTTQFTVTAPVTIEYLVIAGGGSGGVGAGGGGGAGGVLSGTTTLSAGSYNITVGAGGTSVFNDNQGIDGSSSSIGSLIVTTGGGGGGSWATGTGRNGGSGGGASAVSTFAGGTGIAGQGFAGSARLDTNTGGGGGGAGAAASGKNGAIGITSTITGITKYYAGGGGAGSGSNIGLAFGGTYQTANGTYGGGNGASTSGTKQPFQDALANTGGGGGGTEGYTGNSGAGGSGIVIIRYILSSLGSSTKIWKNGYINDVSVSNIDVSGNLNPLNANNSSLGASAKYWGNAYIRDVSVSNIDLSGHLIPLVAANSSLGSLLKRWKTVYADDIILNKINGATYSAGGGSTVLTSITSNVVPSTTNTYSLGSITNYWNNTYINNLRVVNRAQEMNLAYIPSNISIPFIPSQGQILGEPFTLSATTYSNTDYNGYGSALNSDGTIFAISSASTPALGCVRVYKFNDVSWQLMGPIIYGTATANIYVFYGLGLRLSYDGRTLSTPISGSSGSFGIYRYNDISWNNIGYLTSGRSWEANSLSGDGNTFAIANSIANGNTGTVFVWKYINNVWTSIASITNTSTSIYGINFPSDIALSYDGNTLVGSNRNYPSTANQQGVALVFKYNNISWQQLGLSIYGPVPVQEFGFSQPSISSDGLTVLIGGYLEGRVFKYNAIDLSWQYLGAIPGQVSGYNLFGGRMSSDGTIIATWYSNKAFIWKYRSGSWVKIVESSDGTGVNGYALSADGTVYATCHSTPTFIKIHKLNINGNYYGLAKDAYPSLDPSSCGVKAVQTWTARTVPEANAWRSVCWSPELSLFVAVSENGTNRVMTSPNGITWTARTASELNVWFSVCWSPELKIFVAVAISGTNRVMTSLDGTTWTPKTASEANQWRSVCWSAQLGLFVAVSDTGSNRIMTSINGSTWIARLATQLNGWNSVCWSPELGLFVAVSWDGTNRVMTSPNGTTWTPQSAAEANGWASICWSRELGIFVAVASSVTGTNTVMTSPDGITWTPRLAPLSGWLSICWSPELRLFIAIAWTGSNRVMTSPDGINWTSRLATDGNVWVWLCWSPELGIAVAVLDSNGSNRVMTSSLKGRPPTSYNVFDSTFNSIDETGKWTFQNILTQQLMVNTTSYSSDDRVKHNEVIINNGLDVIDRLTPKFYQKTLDMLDASYNGDLSGHTWTYEAGLIAQEVLQVPDLGFAVSGGDYYEPIIVNDLSGNDLSNNDLSNNDLSKNLMKQVYGLNYNSIFVYGLAAIKELHAKVKAQEISIMNRQIIINSLTSRIEALDPSNPSN